MDVIQHLSADAADPSLGDRVLPGRPVRRLRRLDAERPNGRDYGGAELGVAIEDEKAWSLVERERLPKLLDNPGRSRPLRHREVHHAAPRMVDEDEDVQDVEGRGRHSKEVHPDDGLLVVAEEDLPSLDHVPWRRPSRHVPRHRPLCDVEAEHQQFAMDPRGTPGRVLSSHLANEVAQLAVDAGPARAPWARSPSPEQAEAQSMPANHGVGLHDDEDICPPRPEPAKEDPEEPVRGRQPGPRPPLREDGDLLTEGEVLEGEVGAITEKRAEAVREEEDELSHGARMADLGLIGNVVPMERALRGRSRPTSDHRHCRPGIEFCRTTGQEQDGPGHQ